MSARGIRSLSVACSVLALGGCGLLPTGNRTTVEIRDVEYGEITVDDGSSVVDVAGIKNEGYWLRQRGGPEAFGLYVGFSFGEFGAYETFGSELGIDGTPRVTSGESVDVFIDYDAAAAFYLGDDAAAAPGLPALYADFECHEFRGRLGAGVDVNGFQLTLGVAGSKLEGSYGAGSLLGAADVEISGTNLGGYARAAYADAGSPLFLEVLGHAGDLSGLTINGGFRF